MTTNPQPIAVSSAEPSRRSPREKLAILLIMLGAEGAARILKHLDAAELEAVLVEMAKSTVIGFEVQREILNEFGAVLSEAAASVQGGAEFAHAALEKSLGAAEAAELLNRVAPSRSRSAVLDKLGELEPGQLFNALKKERPQSIALAVSCLPPERASQVLTLFTPEAREELVERLATLEPTPREAVERAAEVLLRRAGARQRNAMSQTGGLKAAASVLNACARPMSHSLLSALEQRKPELGQAIRQKMFTFEDFGRLEPAVLQRILREVDLRDLAVALKRASDPVRSALLCCISKRAAETVKEEMSFLGALKLREIEAAQLRIIGVLRRLETEGEVDLGDSEPEISHETVP